jgi:transposase
MTLGPNDHLSILEMAERMYPLDSSEIRVLADALRATERLLERARDERDAAQLQVRLLQRQIAHFAELLTAWQEATREAVSGMHDYASSPIPKLLRNMIGVHSRLNAENLSDLQDTLNRFPSEEPSHEG